MRHYIDYMSETTKADEYGKQWRADHPDYNRAWHQSNPGYAKEQTKKWREANRDKYLTAKRIQQQKYNNTSKAKALVEARYKQRRELVDKVKLFYGCSNPGCPCVGELDPCCLDFHHVDASTKCFHIGSAGRSLDKMVCEICKCVVVCAICHRLVTWNGLDPSQFPLCEQDVARKLAHGT